MRILSLLLAFAAGFAASSPPAPAGGQIVLPQPCSPAAWTCGRFATHAAITLSCGTSAACLSNAYFLSEQTYEQDACTAGDQAWRAV
jgi:hypothetical protein